jgi:chemotaxis family two-component system sensor kinase Cph1
MDKHTLAVCEQEPLHLSGAILSHGTLLVVDAAGQVSHAAANIADWLGAPAAAWVGQPLPTLLAEALTGLADKCGSRLSVEGAIPAPPETGKGELDLVASRNAQGAITLELVRHSDADGVSASLSEPAASVKTRDAAEIALAQAELVRRIGALTGFQRVMLYRFREDGDGEVIAEARQDETYGSYMGLRFPASDIPLIARALYLKNPWRLIPDSAAESVPVMGAEATPPDLTYSDLRSVSNVHRVYLANMGVRASLSFPLLVGGALTALVACHHNVARQPSLSVLNQAARLVHDFAIQMTAYQTRQRIRLVDGLAFRFDDMRTLLQRHGDVMSAWPELAVWLMREFKADGAIFCRGDTCASIGASFEAEALAVVDEWFCQRMGEATWSTDSLIRQVPDFPLSQIAGVLALRVKAASGGWMRVYLTRLEYIHEVAWGGNPEKPVEYHDGTLGIAPRRSFEKWMEKRLGYSRAWDNEARLLAFNLRDLLF